MKRPQASGAYGYCFLFGMLLMGAGLVTSRAITAIGIVIFLFGFGGMSISR